MWGNSAKELLEGLKKAQWLPEYDAKQVRESQKQVEQLQSNVQLTLDAVGEQRNEPYFSSNMLIHHAGAQHITNCLNCYHMHRVRKLEEMWWEKGTLLDKNERDKLDDKENDFLQQFDDIMSDYCTSVGLNLHEGLTPPKSLYIEIDVLEDIGEIAVEGGFLHLQKGMRQLVKHDEVEILLRRGQVKLVKLAY